MAHSKTQIYIQAVFGVKYRDAMLLPKFRPRIFAYMSELLKEKKQFPIIINGVEDHVHLFFGMSRTVSIADVMKFVKGNTSKFINEKKWLPHRFEWQTGYGAFSYSESQKESVINYIKKQEEHHKIQTFETEYKNMLEKFNINYEPEELFHKPM
jgi:putative transposase